MKFIAWLSGIVNYGIYPAVSARFFIYFCGLPASYELLGFQISTFVTLMAILLATALFFVFVGGQIGSRLSSGTRVSQKAIKMLTAGLVIFVGLRILFFA